MSDYKQFHHFVSLANESPYNWQLTLKNGEVVAELHGYEKPPIGKKPPFDTFLKIEDGELPALQTVKVGDGWIVLHNHGEFGGALSWFSEDGKIRQEFASMIINELVVDGDRIFGVEGLSHLMEGDGSLVEIKKQGDQWRVEEMMQLPGSAHSMVRVGPGDFVVMTQNSLLRVNLDGGIVVLAPDIAFRSLYPNSIVTDGTYVFIGMRQYVAKCTFEKRVQNVVYLIPGNQWLNK